MDDTERFTAIGRGKIAAVATTLELRARPALRPEPTQTAMTIVDPRPIDLDDYLALFRRVGAEHLWYSRLVMPRADLERALADPATHLRVCRMADGCDEGLLEMSFATSGSCEIKYFGVTATLQGTGAARQLMNHAIATAFDRGVDRLWLHTNTIDHPRAMAFYRRTGYRAVEQRVEIVDDPRLTGLLPREAAPHVPIFD